MLVKAFDGDDEMMMITKIDRSLKVAAPWWCSWGAAPVAGDVVADVVLRALWVEHTLINAVQLSRSQYPLMDANHIESPLFG